MWPPVGSEEVDSCLAASDRLMLQPRLSWAPGCFCSVYNNVYLSNIFHFMDHHVILTVDWTSWLLSSYKCGENTPQNKQLVFVLPCWKNILKPKDDGCVMNLRLSACVVMRVIFWTMLTICLSVFCFPFAVVMGRCGRTLTCGKNGPQPTACICMGMTI